MNKRTLNAIKSEQEFAGVALYMMISDSNHTGNTEDFLATATF